MEELHGDAKPGGRASVDRRAPVGNPTLEVDALRRARVAAVGASFLRARPLVVLPFAAAQAGLLASSGAPASQRLALSGALGGMVLGFFGEAWLARRSVIGPRWLGASLAVTALVLALGCALSGGASSPLLPLVLAPLVVAFAAFGRRRQTLALMLGVAALMVLLAALPRDAPFAPIAEPAAGWMRVAAFAASAALAWVGVASLVDAHAEVAATLDVMRRATLEEAGSRMRAIEQVGAKVAHEIKNPLAAMKALLQLVQRGAIDERERTRVEVALGETGRIEAIVRDYLAFTRPLADLRPEPSDLRQLAVEVVAVLEARARAAGVTLGVQGDAAPVLADPRRLREALLNLADNAIAATPSGGSVTLEVDASGERVVVIVRDTGRGLPQAIAMAPGEPSTAFTTTRSDGTGLGLTIARAAILQHGGSIDFAPAPGGGTVVTVRLPRSPELAEARR